MIADTQPDVVLLDVHVPGGNGGGGAEILTRSKHNHRSIFFCFISVRFSRRWELLFARALEVTSPKQLALKI